MARKIVKDGKKVKELSSKKLEDLKYNARGILANVRREMLNQYPFFGAVAMSLDLVPVRDVRNPTACTDGTNIFFDIDFLSSLNDKEAVFVIAHEVFHCILLHLFRLKEFDNQQLANLAADMEANTRLKEDGHSLIDGCILPDKFGYKPGLTAEQYYKLLEKDVDKAMDMMSSNKNAQFDTHCQEGQSMSNCEDGNGNGESSNGNGEDGNSNGENDANSDGKNVVVDKYGKVGLDSDFQPAVKAESKEKIREAVVSAAQATEKSRGNVPDYIKTLVNQMTSPKISWKEVLANFFYKAAGNKSSWDRPNRRFVSQGVYLPCHQNEALRAAVILDTSGSTANDISQFLTEVNTIVKLTNEYSLTVIQCDAEVQAVNTYTDANPLDLERTKFEICGGGGTILKPAFDKITDEQYDVDLIICFTDGYCEDFNNKTDLPNLPILWVISDKNNIADNIKIGDKCYFEK